MPHRFDIVIIGSGAGGGTMAQALASSGAHILILERGGFVPREPENWDATAVWKDLRYRTTERWLDRDGRAFLPYTHYCVGGNTKFWGSVLYRLRTEDFEAVAHLDGVSPAWPIDYATLEPLLRAGRAALPGARRSGGRPHGAAARAVSASADSARARDRRNGGSGCGSRVCIPSPLPLGLIDPGEPDGCILCNTCNSFPCQRHAKSEGGCLLRPARDRGGERHALDRRVRQATAHRRERPAGRGGGGRTRRGNVTRRGAARRRCLRGGQLGRPAAAVGRRPAPGRAGELVGAGRPGATWRTWRP